MYEDEASFQQHGTRSTTWALKGVGTIVEQFPTRESLKVFGAVTAEDNPRFNFRFAEVFNAETFQAFLRQLITRYAPAKIHLIVDNVRYHHAKRNQEWLESVKNRLELHFLPAYSPEFNATEKVWKKTRQEGTHNRFFETVNKLHKALFRRFNRFQGNPASLRNVIAPFVR